jgi:hypothetical protein
VVEVVEGLAVLDDVGPPTIQDGAPLSQRLAGDEFGDDLCSPEGPVV